MSKIEISDGDVYINCEKITGVEHISYQRDLNQKSRIDLTVCASENGVKELPDAIMDCSDIHVHFYPCDGEEAMQLLGHLLERLPEIRKTFTDRLSTAIENNYDCSNSPDELAENIVDYLTDVW
jgi:hypothetical protein